MIVDRISVKTNFVAEVAKVLSEGREVQIFPQKYLPTNTVDIVIRVVEPVSFGNVKVAQQLITAKDLYRFGIDNAWTNALVVANEMVKGKS